MIIKKAEYIISGTNSNHIPNLGYPEFVFIGRSNVGKSSFINALANRKNLAYTSSKPGKTISLNFYNINDQYLFVDVPGYGYAKQQVKDRLSFGKMIEDYLSKSKQLKICFLVVDSRHQPTKDDVLMYEYLKHFNLNVAVIATKTDKISKNELNKNLSIIKKTLNLDSNDQLIPISSINKFGIDKVHELITQF